VVCAIWNQRNGIAYKEEELDEILQANNIKIAAVAEINEKLKGTRTTKNHMIM
jgi:hypothetical protein